MAGYVSESQNKVLFEGVQYLRSNDLLFDYTLVAEGESFHVHKVVMAACSDYFRVLLCSDMRESKESQVVLTEVKAGALESLVNFMYTGKLKLSIDNIEEIVSGVSYLQMPNALDLCRTFLKDMLKVDNVLYILNLAEKYVLDDVQITADDFLLEKFEELPNDSFLNLSGNQLMSLLGRDSLHIFSEYGLFEKTVNWIDCNPSVNQETLLGLLDKVRYPLMSGEELFSVSQTKVMTSPVCQDLLKEAEDYRKNVLKQPLLQTENTQVRGESSYVMAAKNMLFYSRFKGEEYAKVLKRYDDSKFYFEQITVVDNFLYVLYVPQFRYPSFKRARFERYDPRFNVWEWLPSPIVNRQDCPLVPYQQHIYAIGGFDQNTVEVFSIPKNKWEMMFPISFDNACSAGVAFDDNIYVTGGCSCSLEEYYSAVNCYTPATDSWEVKSPMIHARFDHHMAVVKGRMYAFGGGMGDHSAFTAEYYTPEVDQWTGVKLDGGVCGLIVDNDVKIVTIGGPTIPLCVFLGTYDLEEEKTSLEINVRVRNHFSFRRIGEGRKSNWMMMSCGRLVLPFTSETETETDTDTETGMETFTDSGTDSDD